MSQEDSLRRVEGRVALVTGAARGIGLAICRRLAAEGARVVVADVDDAAGEAAAQSIRSDGGQAIYRHHDAGDEAQWRQALDTAIGHYGHLDILVNNAYSGAVHTIASASLDDEMKAFRVTAHGVFLGLKLGGPALSDGGAIVNISSLAAYKASPGNAIYAAAKQAAGALSQAAAVDYAPRGIRVNIVAPGIVMTPSLISTVESLFKADTPEKIEGGLKYLKAMSPLRKIAEPIEIANAVLFLVSDEATFITGAELMVDGGAALM
jgi:NAD(P)-dependent dehydrogenase (short-subunit alcohol dehydrogenase family)